MSACLVKEVSGDLFTADKSYSLCHCVAADLKMGKGIAVMFRNKFGQVELLRQQNVKPGGVAVLRDDNRFVYNLITKQSSWGKPTYQLLHSSLSAMRDHMIENSIKKVAMPRIGCGLDGLDWSKVKDLLTEVFKDDDVQLVVYNYSK